MHNLHEKAINGHTFVRVPRSFSSSGTISAVEKRAPGSSDVSSLRLFIAVSSHVPDAELNRESYGSPFPFSQERIEGSRETSPKHSQTYTLCAVVSLYYCAVERKVFQPASSSPADLISSALLHRLKIPFSTGASEGESASLVIDKLSWISQASLAVLNAKGEFCILNSGVLLWDLEDESDGSLELDNEPLLSLEHVQDFSVALCDQQDNCVHEFAVASTSKELYLCRITRKSSMTAKSEQLDVQKVCVKDTHYRHVASALSSSSGETPVLLVVGCSQRSSIVFSTWSTTNFELLTKQEIIMGPNHRCCGIALSDALLSDSSSTAMKEDKRILISILGVEEALPQEQSRPRTLLGKDRKPFSLDIKESLLDILHERCLNQCYNAISGNPSASTIPDAVQAAIPGGTTRPLKVSSPSVLSSESLLLSTLVVTPPDIRHGGVVHLFQWQCSSRTYSTHHQYPLSPKVDSLLSKLRFPSLLRLHPRLIPSPFWSSNAKVHLNLFDGSTEGWMELSMTVGEPGSVTGEVLAAPEQFSARETRLLGVDYLCPLARSQQSSTCDTACEAQRLYFAVSGELVSLPSPALTTRKPTEEDVGDVVKPLMSELSSKEKKISNALDNIVMKLLCWSPRTVEQESRAPIQVPKVSPHALGGVHLTELEAVIRRVVQFENRKLLKDFCEKDSRNALKLNAAVAPVTCLENAISFSTLCEAYTHGDRGTSPFSEPQKESLRHHLQHCTSAHPGEAAVQPLIAEQVLQWIQCVDELRRSGHLLSSPSLLSLGRGLCETLDALHRKS